MAKSKALTKQAMTGELLMVAKVASGVVAGNVLVNALKKTLKVDASSPLPKRLIPPVAVAAAGAIGSIKAGSAGVKQVAAGIGAAGVVHTMRAVAPNAAVLQGLGATDDEHLGLTPTSAISTGEDWVYRDSSGHLAFPDLGEAPYATDLGEVQPPALTSGYTVDAPAYLGDGRDDAGMLGVEDAQIL